MVITVVLLWKEVLQIVTPCHWSSGSWHNEGNAILCNVRNHYPRYTESSNRKIFIYKLTYLFVFCDVHNAPLLCLFHFWLSPRTLLPHHLPNILLPLLHHIMSIYDPPVSLHTKNNRNTDDIPPCGIHLLHSWNWLNDWWCSSFLLVTSWKFQTLQKPICLAACDISFIVWPINWRTGMLNYRGQVTRTMLPEQGWSWS